MKNLILELGNSPDSRGFFSFVNQYLSACRYFNEDDDIYITIDLIKKSKYYDQSITYTDNVWEYFFKKNELEFKLNERTVWGEFGNFYGYKFDFNNLKERILSEEVINKNLQPTPELSDKINKFYEKNFKGKKILGIHKRGTDIGLHHSLKEINEYFNEIDAIKENYDNIFISTDERSVINVFKDKYPNILFYSYESLSVTPGLPNFKAPTVKPYKMLEDIIIDAYLLSKTSFLIQTNSNLSNFALLANSNLKFKRI